MNERPCLLGSGGYIVCTMGVVRLQVPAKKKGQMSKEDTANSQRTFLSAQGLTNIDVLFPAIIKYPLLTVWPASKSK
jgi:hypothetical protein